MSEYIGSYRCGLPAPDTIEYEELRARLTSQQDTTIDACVHGTLALSPSILEVVQHDIAYFEAHEAPNTMHPYDLEEYKDGIYTGYEFIIGCFTYLFFLRSGYDSLEEYLSDAPNRRGEIPLLTEGELARVKDTHIGRIPTHPKYQEGELSDIPLAGELAENYSLESPYMAALYVREANRYQDEDGLTTELSSKGQGFVHGVENALLLYRESRDHIVLSELDFTSSLENNQWPTGPKDVDDDDLDDDQAETEPIEYAYDEETDGLDLEALIRQCCYTYKKARKAKKLGYTQADSIQKAYEELLDHLYAEFEQTHRFILTKISYPKLLRALSDKESTEIPFYLHPQNYMKVATTFVGLPTKKNKCYAIPASPDKRFEFYYCGLRAIKYKHSTLFTRGKCDSMSMFGFIKVETADGEQFKLATIPLEEAFNTRIFVENHDN